jgi:hypothetical protein
MQQNSRFDHSFGTLRGVRSFAARDRQSPSDINQTANGAPTLSPRCSDHKHGARSDDTIPSPTDRLPGTKAALCFGRSSRDDIHGLPPWREYACPHCPSPKLSRSATDTALSQPARDPNRIVLSPNSHSRKRYGISRRTARCAATQHPRSIFEALTRCSFPGHTCRKPSGSNRGDDSATRTEDAQRTPKVYFREVGDRRCRTAQFCMTTTDCISRAF